MPPQSASVAQAVVVHRPLPLSQRSPCWQSLVVLQGPRQTWRPATQRSPSAQSESRSQAWSQRRSAKVQTKGPSAGPHSSALSQTATEQLPQTQRSRLWQSLSLAQEVAATGGAHRPAVPRVGSMRCAGPTQIVSGPRSVHGPTSGMRAPA